MTCTQLLSTRGTTWALENLPKTGGGEFTSAYSKAFNLIFRSQAVNTAASPRDMEIGVLSSRRKRLSFPSVDVLLWLWHNFSEGDIPLA